MNETIDSILSFWFGDRTAASAVAADRKSLWWGKDEAVDEEIQSRFEEIVEAIAKGELNHWRESDHGLLASIICMDQFPRNMYRGTARAFEFDAIALELAQQAVATSVDTRLIPIRRVFVYMPYEHSERIDMQNESVRLFRALEQSVDTSERELFADYTKFAERHQEIIDRFDRFPHRNRQLGRQSTDEEKAFLEQPGSSF